MEISQDEYKYYLNKGSVVSIQKTARPEILRICLTKDRVCWVETQNANEILQPAMQRNIEVQESQYFMIVLTYLAVALAFECYIWLFVLGRDL